MFKSLQTKSIELAQRNVRKSVQVIDVDFQAENPAIEEALLDIKEKSYKIVELSKFSIVN